MQMHLIGKHMDYPGGLSTFDFGGPGQVGSLLKSGLLAIGKVAPSQMSSGIGTHGQARGPVSPTAQVVLRI